MTNPSLDEVYREKKESGRPLGPVREEYRHRLSVLQFGLISSCKGVVKYH